MPRILSLLPCSTEMVCALGAGAELVGVSHECDWPPQVAQRVDSGELPVLTRARIGPPLSSAEIHGAVQQAIDEALSVYIVDHAAIARLQPDIIITQDLCQVCAVSYSDVCQAVEALAGSAVEILSLHPRTMSDVWADIQRVAEAIGRTQEAGAVVGGLRQRVEDVRRRALAASKRPAVVSLEWTDPPMFGGLWMAQLIENAGGIALGSETGVLAQTFSYGEMKEMRPDVLLVKPCGYLLEQGLADLPLLMRRIPWQSWPACAEGRSYVCDGHHFFNRPGPRIVDSQEILAAVLHPELFADFIERYAESCARVRPDGSWEAWST